MESVGLVLGTVVGFLGLYTPYNKETKSLQLGLLLDVLLIRRNLRFTLDQVNKVLALSAMLLVVSFPLLPSSLRWEVVRYSVGLIFTHAAYSGYRYFGIKIPDPSAKGFNAILSNRFSRGKFLSVFAGVIAELTVLGMALSSNEPSWCGVCALIGMTIALIAGLTHFYLMEVDATGALGVRPAGLLPFFLAPVAVLVLGREYFHLV